MKFLVVFLAVCGAALAAENKWFTSNNADLQSGQIVDWYTCTRQGNYPDPRACDHYIACTAANIAYEMPCQMGPNGRLFYVPDSGPDETTSYCDYPQNVQCEIASTEDPPITNATEAPTTRTPTTRSPTTTTMVPTSDSTPEPTTEGGPSEGPSNGTCPENLKDGDSCNPMVHCDQCGSCDWYFVCEASSATVGTWRRKDCDVRGNPATSVIMVADKMFFHRGATSYGGICAPGIPSTLEALYRSDPECKNPCKFEKHQSCERAYIYSDPDFTKGIWSDPGTTLLCPFGTKWDNDKLTCVFCAAGEDCTCDPTTTTTASP